MPLISGKLRKAVILRDHFRCRICYDHSEPLFVHHIYSAKTNPGKVDDPNNLVTLCRRHHEEAHTLFASPEKMLEVLDTLKENEQQKIEAITLIK